MRNLQIIKARTSKIGSIKKQPGSSKLEFKLPNSFEWFSARFECWPTEGQIQDRQIRGTLWKVKVILELNPTRMFAQCESRITTLRTLCSGIFPEFNEERAQAIREETLDANDNFFPDANMRLAINADKDQVTEYAIRACLQYIERALNFGSSGNQDNEQPICFYPDWDKWAVKQSETYWEFDCADAVSTVHSIARHASEIAGDLKETYYALGERETREPYTERPVNSVTLTIPLGQKSTKLVIYAKSLHRVRSEVRHLKNPRQIYRRDEEVNLLTTDHLENLFPLLARINHLSATDRAAPFLQRLWARDDRPRQTVVLLTIFLNEVSEACYQAEADSLYLLSPLVANGRISAHGTEDHREAIRLLVHRGVLAPTKNRKRVTGREYAITRQYASVLEQLKENFRRI